MAYEVRVFIIIAIENFSSSPSRSIRIINYLLTFVTDFVIRMVDCLDSITSPGCLVECIRFI